MRSTEYQEPSDVYGEMPELFDEAPNVNGYRGRRSTDSWDDSDSYADELNEFNLDADDSDFELESNELDDDDLAAAWLRENSGADRLKKKQVEAQKWQGDSDRRKTRWLGRRATDEVDSPSSSEVDYSSIEIEPVEMSLGEQMREHGYARQAYSFKEISRQAHRSEPLLHAVLSESSRGMTPDLRNTELVEEYREDEAIEGFREFLTDLSDIQGVEWDAVVDGLVAQSDGLIDVDQAGDDFAEMQLQARDILNNVTYIGEIERREAVEAIASDWKQWLRDNSDGRLCVLSSASQNDTVVKSDAFIRDAILEHFSDEELVDAAGRLVTDIDDLKAAPDMARVVVIDDWILSGEQMSAALKAGLENEALARYINVIEIQLLAATEARITSGLAVNTIASNGKRQVFPVHSYYRANTAGIPTERDVDGNNAYITGSHSSTDYGFELDYIQPMVAALNTSGLYEEAVSMPPLTNIIRTYRNARLDSTKRVQSKLV